MKFRAGYIFLILSFAFLAYSLTIYLRPLSLSSKRSISKISAANGRLVWQKYNCQACHQLYGLGGYLGPDLTNILSKKGKGETVLKAMIKSGTKQMPAYTLSELEMTELLEFLRCTDASGIADPRAFNTNAFLMIEQKQTP